MRVLTVGNMYPPHHLGGYELVWQGAVQRLRALGHDVRVLTTDHREPGVADADEPHVRRTLRWWWRDHDWPRFSGRQRRAVERHDHAELAAAIEDLAPDVVAWWSMGGLPLSLIEEVHRRRLPAVGFVHDDWLVYGPEVDASRTAVDFSGAAEWVFVSETTRHRALSVHALEHTAVAPSGIDHRWLDRGEPAGPWGWRLLYVGRIDERKGLGTALDALAELPGDATLEIVGAGNPRELESLRARAPRSAHFAGPRSRAELPAAYAAADAVVFPVVWDEPWGLVPLEAMALGRPVAATGAGGSGEYLRDGENALLFAPGDAQALAAALTRMAEQDALRQHLVETGRRTAAEHTDVAFHAAVERHLAAAAR